MELNQREKHLLSRSLFRFNCFLAEEFKKAMNKKNEHNQKKNVDTMQEVTALFEKLGLTDKDLQEIK